MKSSELYSLVDDIPLQERRLDSIAWLIQGNDICGSAYFDGDKLLLATNKQEHSPIVTEVIEHLYYVARKSEELKLQLDRDPPTVDYNIFKKKIDNSVNKLRDQIRKVNLYGTNDTFKKDVDGALNKVTDSIIASYLDPEGSTVVPPNKNTALDPQLMDAIRKRNIEFVPGDLASNGKDIHAEMKLVQKLFEKRKVDKSSADRNPYIGVSKRCCVKCSAVIKSINTVITDVIREVIAIRGDQEGIFPAGITYIYRSQ
jgi:hypothetical protein